jgi:transposase-like protein
MGKQDKERRVYTREFKAEAAAPAEKREKPVRLIAADLGINENMLRRWTREVRDSGGTGLRLSPDADGRGTRNYPARGRKTRRCGRRCEAPLHLKS